MKNKDLCELFQKACPVARLALLQHSGELFFVDPMALF